MNLLDQEVEQELTSRRDEAANTPAATQPAEREGDGGICQMFRSAARQTAQIFVLELVELAALTPIHQTEVEQEQAMAQQELSEGDTKALAYDDETAIQHYRQAWQHASSACLHASRAR